MPQRKYSYIALMHIICLCMSTFLNVTVTLLATQGATISRLRTSIYVFHQLLKFLRKRHFFIQENVWSVLCTFSNAQMVEIPTNRQIIHPFTFINGSLRQKYIMKRPHRLCDIPSLFGFQHFHHQHSSKTEAFTLVKFVIFFWRRAFKLLLINYRTLLTELMNCYYISKSPSW